MECLKTVFYDKLAYDPFWKPVRTNVMQPKVI